MASRRQQSDGRGTGIAAAPRLWLALGIVAACAALLVLAPDIDIAVSGLFHDPVTGFVWRGQPVPELLHDLIQWGARALFAFLLAGLAATWWRYRRAGYARPLLGLDRRDWLFLLAALLFAPGLVANTLLKDNWDRARPYQVEAFGGDLTFTPPLVISDQCDHNCSFVAGDAALGFYLHAFAFVARRHSGRVLAGGLLCGALAGLLRIGMGAHFFSDVVFAGIFMVLAVALVHAALYGPQRTTARWRAWLSGPGAGTLPGRA